MKVNLKIFLLCATLLLAGGTRAAPYRISVLTCAPGDEDIASIFGHTAIRVIDEASGRDVAYNFGHFDYNAPNFYLSFLKGTLEYSLYTTAGDSFHQYYTSNGRAVTEQVLNLSDRQASEIVGSLRTALRPENNSMLYGFTDGNCTTKVRDVVFGAVGGNEEFLESPSGHTYRYYLNSYLRGSPWLRLGVNMLLGVPADRKADTFESMFLPNVFFDGLSRADNGERRLVSSTAALNDEVPGMVGRRGSGAVFITILAALLALSITNRGRIFPAVLFILAGILGSIVTFSTLYSDHVELQWNLNFLWCNPLYLILSGAVLARRPRTAKITAVIIAFCSGFGMILWIAGVQALSLPVLAITATLLISARRAWLNIAPD